MKPRKEIPDDPALPAIAEIRSAGLAAVFPALGLGKEPVEFQLCGYTPGARATFEARTETRRLAIKVYARDPAPEIALYEALAASGLAGTSGVRVPRLLAWDRDLRAFAISWLPGQPLDRLIKEGNGRRAGALAGAVLRRTASLSVNLGPVFDPGEAVFEVGKWIAKLFVTDPSLGHAADKVANVLLRTLPKNGHPHLVHGALYARHILDLGDGPGVIDWQRSGLGPLELDAGTFLAKIYRIALRHERLTEEVARAEASFRLGAMRLLDERALQWHRATTLLRLASKSFRSAEAERSLTPDERVDALAEARVLVAEAARHAEAIG